MHDDSHDLNEFVLVLFIASYVLYLRFSTSITIDYTMMTSLTLLACAQKNMVSSNTQLLFFSASSEHCSRHQMHERYVTNKCYLLTTYYRTVFVICNLSKRVLYIKVLILI